MKIVLAELITGHKELKKDPSSQWFQSSPCGPQTKRTTLNGWDFLPEEDMRVASEETRERDPQDCSLRPQLMFSFLQSPTFSGS